ncbi:hypothetical protein [Bradyrhizobium erythrophlei]|uniref:Peptidase U49 n=1 Tax=Bradyrhizobium erythrophlei TaxID=1437360 RepID=A0A1M5NB72_9BRAD|nr:hypothetical protein [Bradyrhizobium erythrophlei]SHG86866.1 hypothetical protein SAMN05443248_2917 [Bradyrhizobium erythrophlei]
MQRCLAAAAIFVISVQSCCAQGADPFYDWLKVQVASIASDLKAKIEPEYKEVASQIYFHVDQYGLANAGALIDPQRHQREVVVFRGLGGMLELVSLALAYGSDPPQCGYAFIDKTYQDFYNNSARSARNLQPTDVVPPSVFWQTMPECQKAITDILSRKPDLDEQYRYYFGSSVLLLLLHETAHHVLGHVEHPISVSPETPEYISQARYREDEADLWAIQRMNNMKLAILNAVPLFLHSVLAEAPLDAEYLNMQTHSPGTARVRRLLEAAATQNPEPYASQIRSMKSLFPDH